MMRNKKKRKLKLIKILYALKITNIYVNNI